MAIQSPCREWLSCSKRVHAPECGDRQAIGGRHVELGPKDGQTQCPLRLLRQQGPSLLSACLSDFQVFRSSSEDNLSLCSNTTMPSPTPPYHASSLPLQDIAGTKATGSSGWAGSDGSTRLALVLSAQRRIPSLDHPPPRNLIIHSITHTAGAGGGHDWWASPGGGDGALRPFPHPPNKTDMSPLNMLGEIILTSTFVPGNQCV